MFSIVGCPQCGRPAEILERFVLESTDGPVEHVGVACLARHRFLMPTQALSRAAPRAAAA